MESQKHHTLAHRIRQGICLALFVLVLTNAIAGGVRADGIVHLYYFYDPVCPVCQGVHRDIIEPMVAEYGARIAIDERDMSDPATFEFLLALEKQFAVVDAGIPEVFIGQDALIGNDPIRDRLRERIDYYLSQGGVALPFGAGLVAPTKAPTGAAVNVTPLPVATPTPPPSGGPTIHMAWFYDPGCDLCERKEHDLNYILDKYPQVQAQRFNSEEEAALFQYLCLRANIPEDRQLVAPTVFVGDVYLVGQEITGSTLEALIQPYLSTGSAEPWAGYEEQKETAEQTIVDRFRSLGFLTVIGAGLIDGLNPCAFATLVFLISYLSARERRGRELLATGAAFTAGVFLAYLGLGLGLLKFLTTIPILNTIGKWIYGLTMLLCLGLAWGSFGDYLKARQGRLQDMSLKLPDYLRQLTRRLIREGSGVTNFVLASFGLGFVVSIVELACTGQVYLPTIIFVLGLPEWRARAALALVIYNLMFIVPLIVVFLLAYFGTTSQQLTGWMTRHAAGVKLGTAVLFLLLAAWLGYSIISV
jgi:cytochrome c biogenesis protein CcdA